MQAISWKSRAVRWFMLIGVPALMLLLAGCFILLMAAVSWLKKSSGLQHTPTVGKRQVIIGSLLLIPIAFYSGWISVASGVFTTMIYLYLLRFDQLHATAMTLAANGLVWNAIGAIASGTWAAAAHGNSGRCAARGRPKLKPITRARARLKAPNDC